MSPAVKDGQINTEPVMEMGTDVFPHIGLGGRRQTHNLSVGRLFADEACHIAVVGPEIMAPARQAMCLVQHPGANLALVKDAAHGTAAQLLG